MTALVNGDPASQARSNGSSTLICGVCYSDSPQEWKYGHTSLHCFTSCSWQLGGTPQQFELLVTARLATSKSSCTKQHQVVEEQLQLLSVSRVFRLQQVPTLVLAHSPAEK